MLALYTISIAAATMAIACYWGYIRDLSSDLTSVAYDYNISYVIFFAVSTRVIISYRMSMVADHCHKKKTKKYKIKIKKEKKKINSI